MIYNLSNALQNQLLKLPETGMGYQIAEVKLPYQYGTHRLMVLNAEIGLPIDDVWTYNRLYKHERFVALKAKSEFKDIILARVVERKEWHNILNEVSNWPAKPAKDNPVELANGIERFVRLSAYANDRRVDTVNKCFLPGTYATTEDDYVLCVNTKDNPVERYALPNDELIQYSFYAKPLHTDPLQKGTVEPDFGKRGGGKEVVFKNGTSKNTYISVVKYGEFLKP